METEKRICPKCSTVGNIHFHGTRPYREGIFRMYQCQKCAYVFKGEKVEALKERVI